MTEWRGWIRDLSKKCVQRTPRFSASAAHAGLIKTQDRTVMSYFVKPLSDQISRAFREIATQVSLRGRLR